MSESQLPLETTSDSKSTTGALVPVQAFPHPVLRPEFAPPVALSGMPNAMSLLNALRRRLLPALLVGLLLAAGAGAAMWFFLPPPKNTARTQLYAPIDPPNILGHVENRLTGQPFLQSQAIIIKDRFVLNAALNDESLANLPVLQEQLNRLQWLESELKVEFPGPEFIQISLTGDRPQELLLIVNAVRKAYLNITDNQESSKREATLDALKKIQTEWEKRSRINRERLRNLQIQNGVFDKENMAIVQKIALEELDGAQKDLVRVRGEIRQLRVEIGLHPEWLEAFWPRYVVALNTTPAAFSPMHFAFVGLLHDEFLMSGRQAGEDIEDFLAGDPTVADHIKKIKYLEVLLERTRKVAKQPLLAKKEKEIQAELEPLKNQVEAYAKRKMKELKAKNGQGATPRERYTAALALEEMLQKEVRRLDELTGNKNRSLVDMADIKDEIAKVEDIMTRASKKIDAMEIEKKAPPRVREFGEGAIVTPDEFKRKIMFTAGAAGAALILVLLAFAWTECQTRKVHSPEEVVQGLGIQLVGTVPDLSQKNWLRWLRPNSGDSAYTQSLLAESVDTARTLVLHAARTEKLQIVMVTSALAGEGKTSLASHLAASLARAGRRTLILDSDLRNPSLHRLFDMTRGPGLSEVLRNETDLAGAIRETPIPNLWLISAGQSDPIALQTLALDNVPQIFEQLRSQYEFILVDSCPVLPVADSLLVGQHVDAVIFSLLREISRMPRVYAAYQRLAMLGVRILGAVVNGMQHDRYGNSGYNYRYVNSED